MTPHRVCHNFTSVWEEGGELSVTLDCEVEGEVEQDPNTGRYHLCASCTVEGGRIGDLILSREQVIEALGKQAVENIEAAEMEAFQQTHMEVA